MALLVPASDVPETDLSGRGVLKAELQQSADGVFFVLANAHMFRRDIITLLDLLNLNDEEESLTILGERCSFPRNILRTSLSDFSRTRVVTGDDSSLTMADVQKTLGYWSKNNKPYAADVMEAFKRYLYYGVFASRSFRTQGQKKFYDFDYQHACLSFAGAVNDAGFECLALAEVRYPWVGSNIALGITRSRKLFELAPTTDNILDAMRKVAIEKPGSKLQKDYLFSCNVLYTAEWKALDLRLQGPDGPSPLAIEFKTGTIKSSDAAKLPRSKSAITLSKLINEAKQESAGKFETEVRQEERGSKRATSSGPATKVNGASQKPKKAKTKNVDEHGGESVTSA